LESKLKQKAKFSYDDKLIEGQTLIERESSECSNAEVLCPLEFGYVGLALKVFRAWQGRICGIGRSTFLSTESSTFTTETDFTCHAQATYAMCIFIAGIAKRNATIIWMLLAYANRLVEWQF
jgi:hypothetical protein